MAVRPNNFWKDFIKLYREHPELWKIKSTDYKNRDKKNKAWENLLAKYKEFDSTATVDLVKRKVISMISSYMQELQNIKNSKKSGAGLDDTYVPTLWYFNEFEFLKNQKSQLDGSSTESLNDSTSVEKETVEQKSAQKRKNTSCQPLGEVKKIRERDEADIYSESWAVLFRKLASEQQIYAKKAIEEILWEGQLGKLTVESTQSLTASSRNQHSQFSTEPFTNCVLHSVPRRSLVAGSYSTPYSIISTEIQLPIEHSSPTPSTFSILHR